MKKSPLATILSIVFIDLIGFGMIIPILPLYAAQFRANEWQIGFLLASYSFMQFLAAPLLGWLSDKYGRRPILLCSLIGSAFGYLLMANAVSLSMLFLARGIMGAAGASVRRASSSQCPAYACHLAWGRTYLFCAQSGNTGVVKTSW